MFGRSALIKLALIIFISLAAIFSLTRGSWLSAGEIGFYGGVADNLTVEAVVSGEPAYYSDQIRMVVTADRIIYGDFEKAVSGKILVILPRYPEYQYGYCLRMSGKLEKTTAGDFAYGDYLAKDGVYVTMYHPWITLTDHACGSPDWTLIYALKKLLNDRIGQLFSEPSGSIMSGLLLGIRRSIPQKVVDDFNRTGLTHILAISGYNITMVISILGVFVKRMPRRARFFITLGGIMVFVVMTGMSASVIRAAIMGVFVITGIYNGRKSAATHCLLWSAALMSLQNPGIILFDMSFQLSFLATLGILLFMSYFEKLSAKSGKVMKYLYESLGVTMSAQILTTPLILYRFGRLSLIAPVTNLIILPMIPLIMFFSFAAIIVSFVLGFVAILPAGVAFILCDLMLKIVAFFSALPFASLEMTGFPLWMMLVYFALVVVATVIVRRPRLGRSS
jgi:competence protein ComEC